MERNIYKIGKELFITSDEEIKEGDWFLYQEKLLVRHDGSMNTLLNCKKIILTTDQDLIKDGVQSIDDEFLEWFVNNPSCEEVEVSYDKDAFPYGVKTAKGYGWYKIIIPKEEPKQFSMDVEIYENHGIVLPALTKQETLEEAAENHINKLYTNYAFKEVLKSLFIDGAKWQQERMYNEEDMVEWTMCMIAQYVHGNTNIWNRDILRESLPKPKTEWEVEFIDGKLTLKQ